MLSISRGANGPNATSAQSRPTAVRLVGIAHAPGVACKTYVKLLLPSPSAPISPHIGPCLIVPAIVGRRIFLATRSGMPISGNSCFATFNSLTWSPVGIGDQVKELKGRRKQITGQKCLPTASLLQERVFLIYHHHYIILVCTPKILCVMSLRLPNGSRTKTSSSEMKMKMVKLLD